MINPSATLYAFLAAQTGVTVLTSTRIWAERRVPMPNYQPTSSGAALVFWQLPGRLDYSSRHLAVPFAFKCYAANDVDAYTLYGALVDALQDAHYAPMYEAVLALAGQTMREPPDVTDWCYVQCSFMCHFLNRDATAPVAVFFGDSITNGTGASDEAHTWRARVTDLKKWTAINSGYSGTLLQNTVQTTVATIGAAADSNGRDTYQARITAQNPRYVLILYGTNDVLLNDAAITAALYQNDLGEIVDGLLAAGIYKKNIIIGSPPYITEAGYTYYAPTYSSSAVKHAQFVAAAAAVASSRDTKYIDVYAYMDAHDPASLLTADGIHPNDAGHWRIAEAFLSVL